MKLFVFATLKNLKKKSYLLSFTKSNPRSLDCDCLQKKSITIAKIKFKWGKYSKLLFREND